MVIDMEKIKIENINLSERLEKIVRDELNQRNQAGKYL
jgi:hypothetical protein